jgi:hypothetical protein
MFDVITGRRNFARIVGSAAGVLALGGAGVAGAAVLDHQAEEQARKLRTVPWPYPKLEPDAVAARAFEAYARGDCMYGAFEALAGAAAEKLGPPYTSFPFALMEYGGGGVGGWGTICGALNGAAAALKLLSARPQELVDALFVYYEREPLPDLQLKRATFPHVPSVAGSPLCHTSVSRWCEASGKRSYAPERTERCGVLTACVARRAAELLNAQALGKPLPVAAAGNAETARCTSCHEVGGAKEDTRTKMDCGGCHFHLGGEHPTI